MKYLAVVLLCGVVVGQGRILLPDDSPWDVPAIEETRQTPSGECRVKAPTGGVGTFTNCLPEYQVQTCADKTRILEHGEQTPPKYWCRKVQP